MGVSEDGARIARNASADGQVLARFVLGGAACAIVPRSQVASPACLGSFELRGQHYVVLKLSDEPNPDLLDLLTPRELQIALLIAAGCEIKEVARRLRISFHTVRVHLGRTYCKLGLHKQTELAVMISSRYGATVELEREGRYGGPMLSAGASAMAFLQALAMPVLT